MRRLASASRGWRALLCSSSLGLILWASASLAAAAASASLASLHGASPLSSLYPTAERTSLDRSSGCSLSVKGCCNPNAKVPSMHLQGVLRGCTCKRMLTIMQGTRAPGGLVVVLLMPGQGKHEHRPDSSCALPGHPRSGASPAEPPAASSHNIHEISSTSVLHSYEGVLLQTTCVRRWHLV